MLKEFALAPAAANQRAHLCHRRLLPVLVFLLFSIVLAPLNASANSVAETTLVTGTVTASKGTEEQRVLKKSAPIFLNDTIRSQKKSFAKIRYNDGGGMLIRPNSEINIASYREAGAASDMTTDLIRGGLRAVTGAIGKANPEGYKVKSPVATIGVRGTDFSARLCQSDCNDFADKGIVPPPDGLYVGVTEGKIEVCNIAGCVTVEPGQFAYVKDASTPPVLLPEAPEILRLDDLSHPLDPDTLNFIPGSNCA